MSIDDQYSNKTIDWAFQQAAQFIQADTRSGFLIDPNVLEALGGEDGLTKKLSSLQDESEKNKIFYIFTHILAGVSKIEINNLQIANFLALFEQVEDAKNFVKGFLNKVHGPGNVRLELLFEMQAPADCTTEQLGIIHQLSKHTDIVCKDDCRNKFKKIVLWLKEIDGYVKKHAGTKELKAKPTKIEKQIDWYNEISMQCFREKHGLKPKDAELLFPLNIGPDALIKFKKLKQKNQAINDEILPAIVVAGDGYFICKLSHDDPRGPFLGLSTGCCQHLAGAGSAAAEYGHTQDNACFYVMFKGKPPEKRPIDTAEILKTRDIVAQCLAWRNPDEKTIVFDSLEMDSLSQSKDSLERKGSVKALFFELAKNLVDDSNSQIERVMLGTGGRLKCGIPSTIMGLQKAKIPWDLGYTDAKDQNLVYCSGFNEVLKNFGSISDLINHLQTIPLYIIEEKRKLALITQTLSIISKVHPETFLSARDNYGDTVLYTAITQGFYSEIVKAILDKVPTDKILEFINIPGSYKHCTPILLCVRESSATCIKVLLDKIPEDKLLEVLDKRDQAGRNALMIAAEDGAVKCIQAMFDKIPEDKILGFIDISGRTNLLMAKDEVRKLIESKIADLEPKSHKGPTSQ